MPTIHEVAKAAGVSPSTVSRSFTDSNLLTEETRARVLGAARRLNYQPRRARVSPSSETEPITLPRDTRLGSQAIGFHFFAPSETAAIQTDAFYAPMLAGARVEAQSRSLDVRVYTTTRHHIPDDMTRLLREQSLAGLLLVGTADAPIFAHFAENPLPRIVLLDNRDPLHSSGYDCVLSDGVGGAKDATRYLLSLGHRRITFVMSEPETATFQDRLAGYLGAMFHAGLGDETRVVAAQTENEFTEAVTGLLTQSTATRPTAIFAANDPHAYRVLQICHTLGLQIPRDVSVMGFDGDQFSGLSAPALTTMQVDAAAMGRLAVRQLLREQPAAAEPPITMEVPVSLVVRHSCAPPLP